MDSSKFTHTLNIQVGVDLTEILQPAYIPGIKKYLGVESDADLFQAIIADKYKKIVDVINNEGLSVIKGEVNTVDHSVPAETGNNIISNETSSTNEETTYIENNEDKPSNDKNTKAVIEHIKRTITDFEENDCEITSITIDENMASKMQGTALIYSETNLDKTIPIDFEEVEDQTLMIITYVDSDQEIKYRIIDKNESNKQEG